MTAPIAAVIMALANPPVTVKDCQTGIVRSDMLYKTDGNYRVRFENADSRIIDDIQFVIHLGAQDIRIRDNGRFAPGVDIDHRFPDRGGEIVLVDKPSLACEVKWVHFTDGSEWRADSTASNLPTI